MRETKEGARESLRSVLRNPNLRRIQLAFGGSLVGDWAYGTAIMVWAFQESGATGVGLFRGATAFRTVRLCRRNHPGHVFHS